MKCPKCKATIDDDSKYCTYCGNLINENVTEKFSTLKDKLIDVYIDKNNEEIKESSFSLPELLLGTFYLLYRKMYLLSFISILILIIGCFFYKYLLLILVVRNTLFAFFFNKVYYDHVTKKVDEITKYKNTDLEKEKICKNKGGTTLTPIFIFGGLLIIGLITLVIVYILYFSSTNIFNNIKDEPKLYDLKYNVPEKFQASSFNDTYSKYYSYMDEDYNYCFFTINQSDFTGIYKDTDSYLKSASLLTPTDKTTEIKTVVINSTEWKGIVSTANNYKYIYATKYNDRFYSITFSINNENDKCLPYYKEVLNSLSFN